MTTTDNTAAAQRRTLPLPVLMAAPSVDARAELADLRQRIALCMASARHDRRRQEQVPALMKLRDGIDALLSMPERVPPPVVIEFAKRTQPTPMAA